MTDRMSTEDDDTPKFENRTCAKCSTELVPGSFYDGRKNVCKECHKDEMRLRRSRKAYSAAFRRGSVANH